MTAVIPETAITETAASPSAHSPFRQRVAIVASLVFVVVVAFVFFISAVQRQLTAKEQLLVGAWEWQSEPGRMVLYFDDRGRSTYSTLRSTRFGFPKALPFSPCLMAPKKSSYRTQEIRLRC
jgi:hypothetical protein